MNALVATLHGRKDLVPVTFDVRAVCMQVMLKPCFLQHFLALGNIGAHGNSNAHRDNTQINDHFHRTQLSKEVGIQSANRFVSIDHEKQPRG